MPFLPKITAGNIKLIPFLLSLIIYFTSAYFLYSIQEHEVDGQPVVKRDDTKENHFKGKNFTIVMLTVLWVTFTGIFVGQYFVFTIEKLLSLGILFFICMIHFSSTDVINQTEMVCILLALASLFAGKTFSNVIKNRVLAVLGILGLSFTLAVYFTIQDNNEEGINERNNTDDSKLYRKLEDREKYIVYINIAIFTLLIIDNFVTKYS